MSTVAEEHCPVCAAPLLATGRPYELRELFELWRPIEFSTETQRAHAAQSAFTRLFRCPTCDLGIFLPQIIGTSRFYSEAYQLEQSQASRTFTYSTTKWDFAEALRDLRPGERVLEIGTGPGFFLSLAQDLGCQVSGVEFNDMAAQAAKSRGFTIFDSLEPLLRKHKKFDCIFAFHVLEHVANPSRFLADLRRLLLPSGRLGIAVPNQRGPIRFIDPCVQDMPPHHATRWSRTTFQYAAERLGFEVARFAREPLSAENSYYYSIYLPRMLFPGRTRLSGLCARALSSLVGVALKGYLGLLDSIGWSGSALLPGQAIYVVLRPQAREFPEVE